MLWVISHDSKHCDPTETFLIMVYENWGDGRNYSTKIWDAAGFDWYSSSMFCSNTICK